MNPVGELLGTDDIELDAELPDKEALLRRMATKLAQRGHLSDAEVFDSLMARERLGSTAVGHGVAIPHARMPQCGAAAVAFVRTSAGIPFDAPDGRPVALFMGLIVPQQANERHLKLLATAASMFNDRALRERLKTSTDANALSVLLRAWPDVPAPPAQSDSAS
jgi:nitrogen PTS system EIIA component